MYLVDTADGRRCTRHEVDVALGEVCHQCVTDPADAPGGQADDVEYQRLQRARVNEYRTNSRACVTEFKRLRAGGTVQEGNLAVKWSAEAVKWARLAEEMQDKVDGREHDLRLIRHEEAMSRVRDAH